MLQRIVDLQDTRLFPYRSLRDFPSLAEKTFVVDGFRVVRRFLESDLRLHSLVCADDKLELLAELQRIRPIPSEKIFICPKTLLSEVVGYSFHQGMMAIGYQPESVLIDDLPGPIIVLDRLSNAENVGAISRSAVAFGFRSVVYDDQTCSPFLRRSVRASMGNVLHMRTHHAEMLTTAITELKRRGYLIVAAEADEAAVDLRSFSFPPKFAIMIGNEDSGIRPELAELADVTVKIPMSPGVGALNAACASSIFFYAASSNWLKSDAENYM